MKKTFLLIASFGAISVAFVGAWLFGTVVPFYQLTVYTIDMGAGKASAVADAPSLFSPYSYAQKSIRNDLLTYAINHSGGKDDPSLLPFAIAKMEELIQREGSNPYYDLFLGRGYAREAVVTNDHQLLVRAEAEFKKAIAAGPRQQELYYAYGTFLLGQSRNKEALVVLKQALDLNDQASLSNYYYGMALFAQGPDSYGDALLHLERFFNDDTVTSKFIDVPDPLWAKATYLTLLRSFYDQQDVPRVLTAAARLSQLDDIQSGAYDAVVQTIQQTGKLPVIQFQ